MRRNVFYSWQSDLDSSTNRNLIEEALKRALKSIRNDESESLEPVIDRDTSGIAGSPSISDSIFAKITQADVLVADVSLINHGTSHRLTPNPNVLIELGYAIAQLGWDRILLVQNVAYGQPEVLPFDLRGRRIVTYSLSPGADKAEIRGVLQGRLENGLRDALSMVPVAKRHAGRDIPLWWGQWEADLSGAGRAGHLFIREVGASGFLFDILVINGSRTGQLNGYAQLVSSDLAYARLPNGQSGGLCEVKFQRRIVEQRRIIDMEESSPCTHYRGTRVYFQGQFVREREPLFDGGYLDELDLQRLYSITGEYYKPFVHQFQNISVSNGIDPFPTQVLGGSWTGLGLYRRGILMRGESGALWAAFNDEKVIRYFTTQTEYKNKLPVTIEKWKEGLEGRELIYHEHVDATSQTPI